MSDSEYAEPHCSPIPAIQSAVLNIGTAASDCVSARDAWIEANWDDSVLWINNAIAQLESARAKIEAHKANNGAEVRRGSDVGTSPLLAVSESGDR